VSALKTRALLAALGLHLLSAAPAGAQPVPENELKAAFIFNFAVFTEWPPAAMASGAALTLCVHPGNSLLPALATLNDKLVNGHRMTLRLLTTPAALRGCQILFLDSLDRPRWEHLRKELAGASVLTISDDRAIGADGSAISLSVENRRIGFDVDLGAVRQARLSLSSKLLRLARSVQ
jgi:hypothetical protein